MADKVVSKVGELGRTVVFRFGPGVDLMQGLIQVCQENNIKSGVITACIGSLKSCKFMTVVDKVGTKFGAGYGDPIVREGPIELLAVKGMICFLEDGTIVPHLHVTLSDDEGNSFGGHLADDGNPTLITVEGAITEIEGVENIRKFNGEAELMLLSPR